MHSTLGLLVQSDELIFLPMSKGAQAGVLNSHAELVTDGLYELNFGGPKAVQVSTGQGQASNELSFVFKGNGQPTLNTFPFPPFVYLPGPLIQSLPDQSLLSGPRFQIEFPDLTDKLVGQASLKFEDQLVSLHQMDPTRFNPQSPHGLGQGDFDDVLQFQ